MRGKRIWLLLVLVLIVSAFTGCQQQKEVPTAEMNYKNAIDMLQASDYPGACEMFGALGHYHDASKYAMYCNALIAADEGNYQTAASSMGALGSFMDSSILSVYYTGRTYEAAEEYENAMAQYTAILQYGDVSERAAAIPGKILERDYRAACALEAAGRYEAAIAAFKKLDGYSDSAARTATIQAKLDAQAAETLEAQRAQAYADAEALENSGRYLAAADAFRALGDYQDSPERVGAALVKQNEEDYQLALSMEKADDIEGAFAAYTELGDYRDSANKAAAIREEAAYRGAFAEVTQGRFAAARETYLQLGEYKDAVEKARLLGVCELSQENTYLEDGIVAIRLQGLWGYIDLVNNYDVAPAWDSIEPFSPASGLATVSQNNADKTAFGLINRQGRTVTPVRYIEIAEGEGGFYTAVTASGKNSYAFVLINPQGEALSAWEQLGDCYNSDPGSRYNEYVLKGPKFTNGTIIATNKNGTCSLLDSRGAEVISGADSIRLINRNSWNDTALVTWKRNDCQLIALNGTSLDDNHWVSIGDFQNGLAPVCAPSNGKWGYIREQDAHIAIEPQYDGANNFSGGYAGVQVGKQWGFINTQNNMVIEPQYRWVGGFSDDRCVVYDSQLGFEIIDPTNKMLYFKQNVYNYANDLDEAGQYEAAIAAFESLESYTDSDVRALQARDKINAAVYASAELLEAQHKYIEAAETFEWLGDYSDASERAVTARELQNADTYATAQAYEEQGKLEEAISVYLTLGDYNDSTRHADELRESINQGICAKADALETDGQYEAAIEMLRQIPDYTGVSGHIAALEEAIRVRDYNAAATLEDEGRFEDAIAAFVAIDGWGDSTERIATLQEKIKQRDYNAAAALEDEDRFEDAIAAFEAMDGWGDSAERITALQEKIRQRDYNAAAVLEDEGRFEDAIAAFEAMDGYGDTAVRIITKQGKIKQRDYDAAAALEDEGRFEDAITAFEAMDGWGDSTDRIAIIHDKITQSQADALYDAGDYADAYAVYATLEDPYHTHAADYAAMYEQAVALRASGGYDSAAQLFASLGSYSDSMEQVNATRYAQAGALTDAGDYDGAIELYTALGKYADSAAKATQTSADMLYDAGDIAGAYDIYASLDTAYQTHAADYDTSFAAADSALAAGNYDAAYAQFTALGNYPGARDRAVQCGADKADALYTAGSYSDAAEVYAFIGNSDMASQSTYQYAVQLAEEGNWLDAAARYTSIIEYSDSREQRYQLGIRSEQAGALADACTIFNMDLDYSNAREMVYQIGQRASAEAQYAVSVQAFTIVGAYKDAAMNLTMDTYAYGEQLHDAGRYDEAVAVFLSMDGFSNTAEKAQISAYAAATQALKNAEYADAVERFTALGSYSDSAKMVKESNYRWARALLDAGEYAAARDKFVTLQDYSDSLEKTKAVKYAIAQGCYAAGEYQSAVDGFHEISGYQDADEQELASRYALYTTCYDSGDFAAAIEGFELIAESGYSDALTQARRSHYALAQTLEATDRMSAYEEFVLAQDYSDAPQQVKTHAYDFAMAFHEDNDYPSAVTWYEIADDYSNAKDQLYKIGCFYFSTQDYELSTFAFKTLAGYSDASDYLNRIGAYFDMQSDNVNAYLAYGYACLPGEESADAARLKSVLQAQTEESLSAGKLDEAMDTALTLAKIDPAEKVRVNRIDFLSFIKRNRTLKIGNTAWKYLGYRNGSLRYISSIILGEGVYKNSSYGAKKTTVDQWLNSAHSRYFNESEQPHVTLWIPSKDELEANTPQSFSNYRYIWTSTAKGSNSHYAYYHGSWSDYMDDSSDSSSCGILPGFTLQYSQTVYDMIVADPSRYQFTAGGKSVHYEPLMELNDVRVPYVYEQPKPKNEYEVTDAGARYTFVPGSNDYYVSSNKGIGSSCALCKITFTTNTGYLYLDCINYAEKGYDYGLISKLDTTLSTSNSEDGSGAVFKSFKNANMNKVQTVAIPVNDNQQHTIYVKFIKDSSGSDYNDTLQFKARFE